MHKQTLKNGLVGSLAVVVSLITTAAQEINSKVIHNYRSVGVFYSYTHDAADIGLIAHGVGGNASYEWRGFVPSISAAYAIADHDFGDEWESYAWAVGGDLAYVFRFLENRINVLPAVGVSYNVTTWDSRVFHDVDYEITVLGAGLDLSYAFNNRLSISARYGYSRDVDSTADGHSYGFGTRIAVAERVAVNINFGFSYDYGFAGAAVGLGYHY